MTTSLKKKDDPGGALALWKEFSPLAALQESAPVLEEEIERTLLMVFRESDPWKRAELLEERQRIREKQELVRQALPKVERLAEQLREHHELFCAGKHPRQRTIVAVGRSRLRSETDLQRDLRRFGEILLNREELARAEKRLEELDRLVLKPYLTFRRRAHRQQEEIEALASFERIDFGRLPPDEAMEVFSRLAEDPRLPIFARALRVRSAAMRFAKERAALRSELAQARALSDSQYSEIGALREERTTRERRIAELEARLAALERAEWEGRQQREARRHEILLTVRNIRRREGAQVREGECFQYDPVHGYLMAEGWRLLRRDLEAGVWQQGKETDHYFFLTVEGLLKGDDFELLFFHEKGRRAIDAVNQFCREALSQEELLRETTRCGFSTAIVEEWLVPFRRKAGLPVAGWLT